MKDPREFDEVDITTEFGIHKLRRDERKLSWWYDWLDNAERRITEIGVLLGDTEDMTEPTYLNAAIVCRSRARIALQHYPEDPKIQAQAERIEGVYNSIKCFSGFKE